MNPLSLFTSNHNSAAANAVASSLAPKGSARTPRSTLQRTPQGSPLASAKPSSTTSTTGAASTSSTSATSSSSSSTITSTDFLTLLVSELKNQDPTQPTDPNAYITQLVGVNSLQQLISINQGIGNLQPPTTPTSTPPPATGSTQVTNG